MIRYIALSGTVIFRSDMAVYGSTPFDSARDMSTARSMRWQTLFCCRLHLRRSQQRFVLQALSQSKGEGKEREMDSAANN